MTRASTRLKNGLLFFHRWLGVGVCLVFLLWFASGVILMYWDYPGVSAADRLSREPALDASRILLSPEQAYRHLQSSSPPDEVSLVTHDGHPAYRFVFAGEPAMVNADDGETLSEFPPQVTLRVAAAWTGQPPGDSKEEDKPEEDQWTVAGEFRALRPIRKYTWPDGEQVYVSTVTGEVVQYTTRASRIGAYLGAIPHWLYFTPLRKHGQRWSRIVVWTSGVGTVTAILGILIGLWMYSPSRPYRVGGALSSIPYTGQKRWHLILGLMFGPLACTWAFSGMLSMDPFPKLQSGNSDGMETRLNEGLRESPIRLATFEAMHPRDAIRQMGSDFKVKELELINIGHEAYYLAAAASQFTRVISLQGGATVEFDRTRIVERLRSAAMPAELSQIRVVNEYESYYLDRHNRLPLPVLFVQLNDGAQSMYYVDPKTARIVRSYNRNSRWNRWLYHGLHSIDLPWLYKYRPAWDIIVLFLLVGGASLCVTSLLLAWRVLGRALFER